MSDTPNPSSTSNDSQDAGDEETETKSRFNVLILLPLVVFLALAGLFMWQMASGTNPNLVPSVLINKPAPQFDLEPLDASFGIRTPDGGPISGFDTESFKGNVSVVNVWASWCPTCRDEHPLLLKMTEDNRFDLIGLAYKDEQANSARFLENHGNPFDKVGMDISGRVGIDWGVYGAPETFIVDRNGIIRYKHIGALTPQSLQASFLPKLEEILAEK
ncbi:cytochrome c biogenesis protein CcmG, thiol:disulfide interchange protein DsbE [Cohaesibacter sp. ES.047]|uniref:DsbE family thiol:disulfide interchange protein n=1 Tax=Cohaesibacter sp. ES.047 TaxID=1798205 RepID=UPI000BB6B82B|nr:DsbE family thiol:disulfide interchange protein [Cohaesibacter sp. ES.047]SNY90604.1 cytochrome c biogenesis protein CcmG, thiol:disulfide interchange protein DsbE [Cohaesibacter sp. ES.047]